jgi:hypothetical protein
MLASASFTVLVAATSLTMVACGSSPRRVETEDPAEATVSSTVAVNLAVHDGKPKGTLTYGDDSRA